MWDSWKSHVISVPCSFSLGSVGMGPAPRGEITGDCLDTWLPPNGREHSCSQEIVKTWFGGRTFPLTLQAAHWLPQVLLPSFWWYECGSRGPRLRAASTRAGRHRRLGCHLSSSLLGGYSILGYLKGGLCPFPSDWESLWAITQHL